MITILTIILLCAGFYFWKKLHSRTARATVAGLTLTTCVIVWLVAFTPNAPIKFFGTDEPSLFQSQSPSQKTFTSQASETAAPAAPATQPSHDKPTAQATVTKTTPSDADHGVTSVSPPIATTDEAIHNRPYGSTVQVVFEKKMHELPGYMDSNDGYVLVVRVDKPDMEGETALEHMKNTLNR